VARGFIDSEFVVLELVIGEVMFAQTLIYALEFALFVLFIGLFIQVYRGYRRQMEEQEREAAERAAASAAMISARAKASVLGQRVPVASVVKTAPIQQSCVPKVPTLKPLPGGSDSVDLRRQPLRADDLVRLSAANNDQVREPVRAADAILNDYIGEFFGVSEKTDIDAFKVEPAVVVRTRSPVSSEDDQAIIVDSDGVDRVDCDRVMSDKVVHAMLDEAKLVCIS
jgi:hypothetical protein